MVKRKEHSKGLDALQRRAEERLGKRGEPDPVISSSGEDLRRIVHELDVHRIELEMQQEELLRSRAALEESLGRYLELYDFAPIGYLSIDNECRILQLNLMASKLLGIERSRLVGQRFDRYVAIQDRQALNGMLSGLFARNRADAIELELEPWRAEPALPGNPSGIDAHRRDPITVLVDAVVSDDASQCRMALTDISERKRIQRENDVLQATVAQVRKLESIGRLAGGVAHDYNNMFQVMLGNIELMQLADRALPVDQLMLSNLRESVMKASALTRQLLAFARNQPYSPEILDITVTVTEMLTMLGHLVCEYISISFLPPVEQLMVKMDPSQIEQIVVNLVINARDAIQERGKIEIAISGMDVAGMTPGGGSPALPDGRYVCLSVSDDGRGMDGAMLENVFEPFVSSKAVFEGAGLGLSSVYGIVKQNHGFIEVSSKIGQGTRFDLYFPRYTGVV